MVILNILVFGWKPFWTFSKFLDFSRETYGKRMNFLVRAGKDIICRLQKLEYMGFREKVAEKFG